MKDHDYSSGSVETSQGHSSNVNKPGQWVD